MTACSFDTPVCCACCCADAVLAHAGLSDDGRLHCLLCGKRIRSHEPHRPHGAGRAHKACIVRQQRAAADVPSPVQRAKRPYDSLRPTQRRERRQQLRAAIAHAEEQAGCPNAVLGLMSPSATHPCFICIVGKNNLISSSRYRSAGDKHSHAVGQQALLTIDPTHIVPTPLHLFLGISNRIILDAFSELLGKENVDNALKQVSTVHSAGCGGKSDLYDLNGPEISKWIKRECSTSALAAAGASSPLAGSTKASHSILSRWLQQLHHSLLHSNDWTSGDIEAWRSAVDDIQQHWCAEAHSNPFPKLHMLRHSLEFAERHRFLGRASEAQIESFHAQFNTLFHDHHLNQGGNTAERLRRCLADASLRTVQPFLQQ